ncbi:MAG TPA: calcium-binding protein [Acidimicrobiales bacterium]|nr:calcium-binding protein [Acidimicrobiales bacterium]
MSSKFLRGAVLVASTVCLTHLASLDVAALAATTCPSTLSFGAPIKCAIDTAGEADSFALSAAAGDAVLIHAVGTGSGLEVDLEMRSGSESVCAARAGASAEMVCKIPATARYAVSVFDSGGDDTGGYRIEAQRINRPVGALSASMGRPRHGVIAAGQANDWYTFAGAANAVVVVRAAVLAPAPIEADLDVFAPNGDLVCATRAGALAQATCTLPTTTAYSVRVADSADDETGGYAFTVRPECTLNGTTDADTITGTNGNDVICGLGGADKVSGGDGHDIIIGGTGDDSVDGGAGDDVILGERTGDGADVVVGGSGGDVLSYAERSASVSVDADAQGDDGEVGEADNVRADIETLVGGGGDDRLLGSAGNNTLAGGPGADVLDGAGGDDTFLSAADPDGADVFAGGDGRDHVSWAERGLPVVADPDGVADDGGAGEGDNVGGDVEMLTGGAGADSLAGGASSDVIKGGAGADVIDGGGGDDRLSGEAGPDSFVVGVADGADVISGGSATDSISYAGRTGGVTIDPDGSANDGEPDERDDIRADVEHVTGGSGNDTIIGSSAANRFDGGAGDDTLRGAGGDDTLVGGAGYDTLDGGDGTDRCDPGPDGAQVDYCDRT